MKDQVILLTGASKGIGKALLEQLEKNNIVIAVSRDKDALTELRNTYPSIHIYPTDLTKPEQIKGLASHIASEWPDLSVLINNAGIQIPADFVQGADSDLIHQELATNIEAPIQLTGKLLPLLLQQKRGLIINITSVLALKPKQSTPVYCASKAALRGFTHALRYQLRNSHVAVVEVMPPLTSTSLHDHQSVNSAAAPAWVASQILKGIESGKQELSIGKARLAQIMNYLCPPLLSQLLIRG